VGKTVVTTLLIRHLRHQGVDVMGVKPYCSGGRDDAIQIRGALGGTHSIDEINPWHFRAAVTPLLAARREGMRIEKRDGVRFLRQAMKHCEALVIEGAGGLLSPLGEGFDARDLIVSLDATPVVVCPNKLGAINQVRLVMEALSQKAQRSARIALVRPKKRNRVTASNLAMIQEYFGRNPVVEIPWNASFESASRTKLSRREAAAVSEIVG